MLYKITLQGGKGDLGYINGVGAGVLYFIHDVHFFNHGT
jgi:hypothetical protein